MYKWMRRWFEIGLLAVILVACDQMPNRLLRQVKPHSEGLEMIDISFSNDHRRIYLNTQLKADIGAYELDDTAQVHYHVEEQKSDLSRYSRSVTPKLLSVKDVSKEAIVQSGLKIYVLIDLTKLDQLDQQSEYVRSMRSHFGGDNMLISFLLSEGRQSAFIPATDYVVDQYIAESSPLKKELVRDSDGTVIPSFLYRSVSATIDSLLVDTNSDEEEVKQKALVIFSDGDLYDEDDIPYDPEHFEQQEDLIRKVRKLSHEMVVFYFSLKEEDDDYNRLMHMVCMRTNGQYYTQFNGEVLADDIFTAYHIPSNNYLFELENPNDRFYFGNLHYLHLSAYNQTDSLLVSVYAPYTLGNREWGVFIGNLSHRVIAMRGVLVGVLLVGFVFLVLFFAVPFVRYQLFRYRYVVRYAGPRMTVGETPVPETCYYCKAPFQLGEQIVAKCKHVMHLECWDENGYHCPEYGRRCPNGSHFYNRHNVFDRRNASSYMKWEINAVVSAVIAWVLFVITSPRPFIRVIDSILNVLFRSDNSADAAQAMVDSSTMLSARMYHLPQFGFFIGLVLALTLTTIAVYRRGWGFRLGEIIGRSLGAALFVFFNFTMECVVVAITNRFDSMLLLDLLLWAFSACGIVFISSYRTRLKPRRERYQYAFVVGCVSALLWRQLGELESATQIVMLILPCIIFAGGIAVSLASSVPAKRTLSFLHVSGSIKEMDIALYKWLRTSPSVEVTIGKSVNCSLQISWDLQSEISPVQAKICMLRGIPHLYALDGLVYKNGQPLKPDKPYTLYHGDVFQIGQTQFRYLEI